MSPSGKFEGKSTPDHDEIHLFVFTHTKEVLAGCGLLDPEDDNIVIKIPKMEDPIYDRLFALGGPDGIIDTYYKDDHTLCQKVVYDIKPYFKSLSSDMLQIKSYRYLINQRTGHTPKMLILTLDSRRKFDIMLQSQDINILHLEKLGNYEIRIVSPSASRDSSLQELFWSKA